ncbi:MAG: ribonuclease T(2) [Nevskiaceae bacterium]|nr:MAG: ribonuclease T(2) [Nevskiaceae bacterium]
MMALRAVAALLLLLGCVTARADVPGRFDYWLLSLSWSPQYCADRTRDPQCERQYGFVVHGLWPQNEQGYPEDCGRGDAVGDELVERMLPLMPSAKLIQHEWRTHGICSGMSQNDYFLTIERAYRNIGIPETYRDPTRYLSTSAQDIRRRFMEANRGLRAEDISLQCAGRYLKEVRLCFDRDFRFRACGEDLEDRCRDQIVLRPSR